MYTYFLSTKDIQILIEAFMFLLDNKFQIIFEMLSKNPSYPTFKEYIARHTVNKLRVFPLIVFEKTIQMNLYLKLPILSKDLKVSPSTFKMIA